MLAAKNEAVMTGGRGGINLLKTKPNLLYIRNQMYHEVNTFHHGYKNQSVNDV
jgi:hypothetical protein